MWRTVPLRLVVVPSSTRSRLANVVFRYALFGTLLSVCRRDSSRRSSRPASPRRRSTRRRERWREFPPSIEKRAFGNARAPAPGGDVDDAGQGVGADAARCSRRAAPRRVRSRSWPGPRKSKAPPMSLAGTPSISTFVKFDAPPRTRATPCRRAHRTGRRWRRAPCAATRPGRCS